MLGAIEPNGVALALFAATFAACCLSFFTLTGMHGFHVFMGVCYLTILLLQSAAGVYTKHKFFGLTAGTLYWHFVDVIWVLLFSIFYLI